MRRAGQERNETWLFSLPSTLIPFHVRVSKETVQLGVQRCAQVQTLSCEGSGQMTRKEWKEMLAERASSAGRLIAFSVSFLVWRAHGAANACLSSPGFFRSAFVLPRQTSWPFARLHCLSHCPRHAHTHHFPRSPAEMLLLIEEEEEDGFSRSFPCLAHSPMHASAAAAMASE